MRRDDRRDAEFSDFVAARQAHLLRVAHALCGDWHRAEDVVQTALTTLYVAWPRVRRSGNPEAYVRRIVVTTDVEERRRPWRRERAGLDGLDQVPTADATGAPEDTDALVAALRRLPPMQRRTVVMRYWLDLSVAQTAEELGVSPGTVKSHAARGLAALERHLAEPAAEGRREAPSPSSP